MRSLAVLEMGAWASMDVVLARGTKGAELFLVRDLAAADDLTRLSLLKIPSAG